ncbi:N-acetylmuramoyl-L-alanine amidase [bacterium]|nr:N-acetylmuramoyl-L-alanine amidase [bacterium]
MEKFNNKITAYLFFVFLFVLIGSASGEIKNVSVVYADKKDFGTSLKASQVGDVFFVSARELANELHWNYVPNVKMRKAVLYPEGRGVKIAGENPYIMIGEDVYQLPVEVKYIGGELFIPLNYFIKCINDALLGDYIFDKRGRKIEINMSNYTVRGISVEDKKNGTFIKIGASKKFNNISNWVLSDGWFYCQIHGGRIDTNANYPRFDKKSNIRDIKVTQTEDYAQIAVKLREDIEDRIIKQDEKTNELHISLTKNVKSNDIGVNIEDILREQKKNWKIDTIVLDPGHGGKDPGCISISRVYEKTIVLDIAKRLGKIIEKNLDVDVKYTRKTDTFIPLLKRAKFANDSKGKLFISIHANSTPHRTTSARGVEIYILSPTRDERSIELAKRENRVAEEFEDIKQYSHIRNGDNMLFAMMQSGFVKESERLASTLLKNVAKKAHVSQRGVKQAGFWVLVGSSMPSVLVEVGYLNNIREEKNLRSRAYRQKIAEGLYEGIKEFVKTNRKDIAKTGS